ncbi:unnamed protein product [Rotaria sp. Silwood2]|nr:unnamed protein product [Rotaria sp. Silwood2]
MPVITSMSSFILEYGNRISADASLLFLVILLAHEITHAVNYIGAKIQTIPEIPYFTSYSDSEEFDGGNALEHELIGGELHINHKQPKTIVELFIIDSNGKHIQVPPSGINNCIRNKTFEPLLQLHNRSKLKHKCRSDSTKNFIAFIKEVGDDDKMSDDPFIPLLRYHTRQNVIYFVGNLSLCLFILHQLKFSLQLRFMQF